MSVINKAYLDFNGLAYYDEKIKEYIPITHGYYNNGNFYSDSTLTTLITGEANRLYIDLISNNFYEYKNNTYVLVGSGIKVFTGSLSEWNQLSTAEKKTYDFISNDEPGGDGGQFPANKVSYDNTVSGLVATDVQGAIDELAESYPASQVMMSDGETSVEDALDAVDKAIPVSSQTKIDTIADSAYINYTPTDDGYIGIWCESGSSQKEYKAAIRDNTLTKYGIIITQTIAAYNSEPIGGLYVKKGRTYTIRNAGSNSFDVYFCK